MLQEISYLINRSKEIYQKEGFFSFLNGVVTYVRNHSNVDDKLLFSPRFPPIILKIYDFELVIGHRRKYIYTDENVSIVPQRTDTVVEAGVYLGRDTATLAKYAEQVIGFEPSPRNYSEVCKKLDGFDNIDLINAGMWNQEDELKIKYGDIGAEDGFLEPDIIDEKEPEGINKVPVNTIENYSQQLGLNGIDFLKIEAEGAEPEIIEGMGELRPKHIVVNADEERDGQPTGAEVMEVLQPLGYHLVGIKRGHLLFFSLEGIGRDAFRDEFK